MVTKAIDVTTANSNFLDNSSALDPWLREMRKCPILKAEKQLELLKDYRLNGNIESRDLLVSCNQRFVYAVAKRYSKNTSIIPDLINEGNIGLLKAIEKFKLSKDNNFLSYAAWYIRCYIGEKMSEMGVVRKTNGHRNTPKFNKIKNEFFLREGRYPCAEEIMEIFNSENEDKINDKSYIYDIESISINDELDGVDASFEESPVFNNKTASYNQFEDDIENEDNVYKVGMILNTLNERDRTIMKMAYQIGYDKEYTNDEIGEILGLTRERVRQIRNSCLRKLKKPLKKLQQDKAI